MSVHSAPKMTIPVSTMTGIIQPRRQSRPSAVIAYPSTRAAWRMRPSRVIWNRSAVSWIQALTGLIRNVSRVPALMCALTRSMLLTNVSQMVNARAAAPYRKRTSSREKPASVVVLAKMTRITATSIAAVTKPSRFISANEAG